VHSDHLNTPRKIPQASTGTLAWRYDADPFGTAAPNQNPGGLGTFTYNLRFPGQYYQAETGLNQNWNRDYDPLTGKYIESDPIGLRSGINTYTYALGNPLTDVDPRGLDVIINISRQGYSMSGGTVASTITVYSTFSPIAPFSGFSMENANAGDCGCKPPIPAGSYPAFIRGDHTPNRIELIGVPGYSNVQIHNGNYPRNFKGCFGVGNSAGPDFLGNSVPALNSILGIINADGTGNITVNVIDPSPFGGAQ